MRIVNLVWPVLVAGVLGACGSDSGGGSCKKLSGTWEVKGNCTESSTDCQLAQSGCKFDLTCDDGNKFTGTVSKSGIKFSMEGATCSGNLDTSGNEPQSSGTCKIGEGTCEYEAECQSGTCKSASGEGGTGGSTGGTGGGGTGGGGTGGGGTGGTGGGGNRCSLGASAVCTCLEDTDRPCASGEQAQLAQACTSGNSEAAFVGCFGDEVVDGQIDCAAATNACIE